MTVLPDRVILFDVDNTLLDNDHVQADLRAWLASAYDEDVCNRYWANYDKLFKTLGYADYLGAAQALRLQDVHDLRLLGVGKWLLNYPYAERLYPGALEALAHARNWGPRALLSDGDAVFQPRKLDRAGLWEAVHGEVMIFVHKEEELAEISRRYPASHYVMIDDKIRILSAMKQGWGEQVTTIFVRQGHYALDPKIVAAYPPADITIERIGDLPTVKLPRHLPQN
jgi:phosphoglycolate phosphatase-like HAD superfamily hydrolase